MFTINPHSGRKIRIGSRTHQKLVKSAYGGGLILINVITLAGDKHQFEINEETLVSSLIERIILQHPEIRKTDKSLIENVKLIHDGIILNPEKHLSDYPKLCQSERPQSVHVAVSKKSSHTQIREVIEYGRITDFDNVDTVIIPEIQGELRADEYIIAISQTICVGYGKTHCDFYVTIGITNYGSVYCVGFNNTFKPLEFFMFVGHHKLTHMMIDGIKYLVHFGPIGAKFSVPTGVNGVGIYSRDIKKYYGLPAKKFVNGYIFQPKSQDLEEFFPQSVGKRTPHWGHQDTYNVLQPFDLYVLIHRFNQKWFIDQ